MLSVPEPQSQGMASVRTGNLQSTLPPVHPDSMREEDTETTDLDQADAEGQKG
jgi:hypothetical protein